jgi:hypothetical protein
MTNKKKLYFKIIEHPNKTYSLIRYKNKNSGVIFKKNFKTLQILLKYHESNFM